ncbi:MAG: phytoene/squalene synthase family protein [Serpentinimonas sp.]|nr:phytoene/squalene synthase family protein [Serpentinimonas sp.]
MTNAPDRTAQARADMAACRAALREGSYTFYAASLILPPSIREPASALYAFCRLADDVVDNGHNPHAAVALLRRRLDLAYRPAPTGTGALHEFSEPVDRAMAALVQEFDIPRTLPEALLDGFEWDANGRRYETLEDVQDYAARVAGSVGAMMALLMGVRSPQGLARACDLGVAMQLSNIARDVGEDARMGRLYLPRQWLREAGVDPDLWLAQPEFTPAIAIVVQRLTRKLAAKWHGAGAIRCRSAPWCPAHARPGCSRKPLCGWLRAAAQPRSLA